MPGIKHTNMKSTLKIDFEDNGSGLEPVIIAKIIDSDDPRDKLLKTFFQKLGGESSWLQCSFRYHEGNEGRVETVSIRPVAPSDFSDVAKSIDELRKSKMVSL